MNKLESKQMAASKIWEVGDGKGIYYLLLIWCLKGRGSFCPLPLAAAAAARDPCVSFVPSLWSCEPKHPFGWFCCLEVLELWRSECLCLFAHGYQKLMSLHLFSTFHKLSHSPCPSSTRLSSPKISSMPGFHGAQPLKTFPILPALLQQGSAPETSSIHPACFHGIQPPKTFAMVPALLQQGSDSQDLSHGRCPALLGQLDTFWGHAELTPICVTSWGSTLGRTALRPEEPLTSPVLKDALQRHSPQALVYSWGCFWHGVLRLLGSHSHPNHVGGHLRL